MVRRVRYTMGSLRMGSFVQSGGHLVKECRLNVIVDPSRFLVHDKGWGLQNHFSPPGQSDREHKEHCLWSLYKQ